MGSAVDPTPTDASTQALQDGQPDQAVPSEPAGFGSRGRVRRRARFLRRARELAYRDLGGLVFNLHRFGQRNDALVLAKLTTLGQIDAELRTLEEALHERRPVTVLREAGITACPRCAAIHGSEDRFCPNCGLPMARNVDLPIAGAATADAGQAAPAGQAPSATAPAQQQAAPASAAPSSPSPPPPAPGPGAPAGAPAVGRSPTPPQTLQQPAATTPPVRAPGRPAAAEESTEILHPPAQRS